MPSEDSNIFGAMQNSSERRISENVPSYNNNYQQQPSSSSYLILSPSNPLRTFAISFLTHWTYSTVIIVTICAFVISSSYLNFWSEEAQIKLEDERQLPQQKDFSVLTWTRRILCVVILLEIILKSFARGFVVGAHSYLRIAWDWLDVISLVILFVSMIIPWKAVESLAAGIVLLKLIPIHPGSINAFISLCSCAKKLIPVLVYGIIIVWIYGVIIFTLFVKYQQDIFEDSDSSSSATFTKTNESASDSAENDDITEKSHLGAFVDGDYHLAPSTKEKSENFSFGLSVECLPTNLRSLSGSLIQASQMLTLGFSQADLTSKILRANISNLNQLEYLCQYEMYTLSIVETLVIITGTLPMITMTFGALYNFFQKETNAVAKPSSHNDDNETEHESHSSSYQFQQRRRLGSGISGRSSNSHSQNYGDEGSSCLNSLYKQIANILCDCDYYFCCLANLQRRLYPFATRLLNSKRFKVCVMLVVSLDFLCMILLLCFSNRVEDDANIDFSPTVLITYCLQTCFVLYTIEAVFKWLSIGSDEYWQNIWSAFDLALVIVYWIGYTIIHLQSLHSFYPQLCGILIMRMLKIVPYWTCLQLSLKLMMPVSMRTLHSLFVILICSFSIVLLKYGILIPELQTLGSSTSQQPSLSDSSANTLYLHILEHFANFILYFLCCAVIICIFVQAIDILELPSQDTSRVNASISLLLNDSHLEELSSMLYQPRRSINESASPISIMSFPGGGSTPMKYSFGASPCASNNGLLAHETPSMLSPSSEVLSPLLSIPTSNEHNGHVIQPPLGDTCHALEETNRNSAPDNDDKRISRQLAYHSSSTELAFDLASAGVIILACVNKTLDSSETGGHFMRWNTLNLGQSLWLELLFIVCVTAHLVYKTRLSRFARDTFIQISCVCDLLMVLAAITEIFSSGMKYFPPQSAPKTVKVFLGFAKVLTACRGLLIFSRISWLKSVGCILCNMMGKALPYISSYTYFWLNFIISSSEAQKMIESISKNHKDSTRNSTTTTSALSLENLGSIETDPNLIHSNKYFVPHILLIALTIVLFLLSLGGFLGLLVKKLGGWHEIAAKFSPGDQKPRASVSSTKLGAYYSASVPHFSKPTEGICVPVLYFVTNHPNFDIIVMTIILFDGLGITLEYLATSERALILRKHYPAYILFLYLLELSCKLAANGLHFFKSNWNLFDAALIGVSIMNFLISLLFRSNYINFLIMNIRFLRILRIFQFRPFIQRAQLIQKLYFSTSKAYAILRNLGAFYCSLFFVVIIYRLRCVQLLPTGHHSAFWITAPFQTFSAQDIYNVIGNLKLFSLTMEYYAFFFLCLVLFSLIRISVIFTSWLVLFATLINAQAQDVHKCVDVSTNVNTYLRNSIGDVDDAANLDGKYYYMEPCISPETLDIETPSSSGTACRGNSSNNPPQTSTSLAEMGVPESSSNHAPKNSLYKTTTITSEEEINGCKVFYVELITTV